MKGQVAIPESSEELEELLNDDGRMTDVFNDGKFGDFTRAYMGAWTARNTNAVKEYNEQLQAELQNFLRDQVGKNGARAPEGWRPGASLELPKGKGARRARAVARAEHTWRDAGELFDRQGLFSATAAGAAEDIDNASYSETFTKFVWAALKGEAVAAQGGDGAKLEDIRSFKGGLARALEIKNAGMAERIPSEGGFLVPETLRSEILALSLEDSVMRPQATVIPMDSLRVPLPSIDDTSHTANVFGGVAAFWTAEGAALTVSAPKFSRVLLEASKLTAFTQIPNELLQDASTAMDVWFRTFFPQAVTFFEDLGFLVGDGVNRPEGVLNCPGAVSVSAASGGSVQFVDLAKMLARIWPPSLKRSFWVCSNDVLEQLLLLAVTTSGTTIAPPGWLEAMQAIDAPGGSDGSGYTYRLFGRPLRVTEKVPYPGSGSAGCISLIDPKQYLIGDRQAMQVASSADYSFANDMVSYRVTERLDGRGWMRSPLTPANGSSNTLSPFVLLNS